MFRIHCNWFHIDRITGYKYSHETEDYIKRNGGRVLDTHGICPECHRKMSRHVDALAAG